MWLTDKSSSKASGKIESTSSLRGGWVFSEPELALSTNHGPLLLPIFLSRDNARGSSQPFHKYWCSRAAGFVDEVESTSILNVNCMRFQVDQAHFL